MNRIVLLSTLVVCQFLRVYADDVLLTEVVDSKNHVRLRYIVDSDYFFSTPSWAAGEAIPLDQEKLFSIVHERYPELNNAAICGIELNKLTGKHIVDGKITQFDDKWYYTVLWMKDNRMERIIVLMDGSIVEPKQTASIGLFDRQPAYIGDDPNDARQMKQQIDEQLQLLAPSLAEPGQ